MPRAGLALGSNLGDRLASLRTAVACLCDVATQGEPVLVAPIYQTKPLDCPPGSPDFYNSVIEIEFIGNARELLSKTRAVEKLLGRTPGSERNSPRVIDIDLLYFGDLCCDDPMLVLPHPRLGMRRFVLQPLADIRPTLVLPGQQRTISEMLKSLSDDEPLLHRVC